MRMFENHWFKKSFIIALVGSALSISQKETQAELFTYTKISDTNTLIPDGVGTFTGFGNHFSIHQGNVAIHGFGSSNQDGIYVNVGGTLNMVVDTSTAIPGGSGNFVVSRGPSLDNESIAFTGFDSANERGIYKNTNGLDTTNHLASGAVSNVFLVKGDELLTPIARGEEVQGGLPSPVLPGVTREAIIELAPQADLEVQKRMLTVNDLLDADEVFLTNSSWLVLPVVRVEKKTIGDGGVGKTTAKLRAAAVELVERETGED